MIEFNQVSKYFHGQPAVENISFCCREGALTVLVGTSGSGKSTTLKMINRLIEYDRGSIYFGGEPLRQQDALYLRRHIGYAIQSIGLFPHWTVARNIATVPRLLNWPGAKIDQRVDELLALLGLNPAVYRQRYPHQLSGGQQQRVGVARALAADPQVLLMDEPFGALDPVTRSALQQEVRRIQRQTRRTLVMVTHDIDEALTLADHLVLMDNGAIIQQGSAGQLLTQPASDFVRDFFAGSDYGIRLMGLCQVAHYVRPGEWCAGDPLAGDLSLRQALSCFVAARALKLPVVDSDGQPLGVLWFEDVVTKAGADALSS
ncbi:ABC transporter ATP-binding protein [Shimwellia pseudoproteus]|uniref:ABC transporter ATP-binding protein n=1 Tax=Shimwellia pseudoproteus TaxID=570012 RepID=UPI0018EA4E9D|nr:ABC transporter ATP-binding protein [Shimwellia pseudoproteus]MBJ3815412.1 ABC transporter ATP-binding protein [Shimwellia pseudoproteus]